MNSLSIKNRELLRLWLLGVYLLLIKTGLAQLVNEPPLDFDHYNYEQGMSTGAMVDIFKDSKGFVWILTTSGINRYDGSEFKIFRSNASDSTTISSGFPTAIAEDKNGLIWIACDIPRGLNAYNPVTGKFTRYCDDIINGKNLPTSMINHLFVDSNNVLWMCTDGEGVYSWNLKTKIITHFLHIPGDTASIGENNIISGLIVPGGNIMFYSAGNIYLFSKKTNKFSNYRADLKHKLSLNKWIPGILIDREDRICIPSDKGLHLLDSSLTLLIEYPLNLQKMLATNTNKFLLITPDRRIWIDADSGLYILDPSYLNYSVYQNDPDESRSISRLMYRGITYDPSGVIWIRGGSGVNKVSLEKEKFHIVYNPETQNRYGGPVISSVRHNYQDRAGQIFQANPKGVFVFNFVTKKFSPFFPDPQSKKFLKSPNIHFIYQDTAGSYWFGLDKTRLLLYNPAAKAGNRWTYFDGFDFNSPGYTYMQSVLQDDNQNIWFAGAFSIYKYNMNTREFKTYFIDASNKKNTINTTAIVMKPGEGEVWFGTIGLSRYWKNRDAIYQILLDRNEAGRILSTSKISCAVNAGHNRMWIGTDGNGVFLFDFKTQDCRRISFADGLPNDRIFAITKDLNGILWISTDGGLCKYVPSKNPIADKIPGTFKTYVTNAIWPVQGYSGKDTTLYFKMYAYTGLLYFRPDSVNDNPFVPPVYITDFKLFNKQVSVSDSTQVLDSAIEVKKRIVLKYNQNIFSFTFAALNFIDSKENQYAYRLVGFDKNWNYTDASYRIASYTNLDPGKYTFEVKGANNDGVWNETPARLHIIITPPYWQTRWFTVLLAIGAVAVIYMIYRVRINQLSREKHIRDQIASDLHDDLGSTLNSVKVYATVAILEKDNKLYMEKIQETIQEAITGVRDIIWVLDEKKDTIEHLVTRINHYAFPLCIVNQIRFLLNIDTSLHNQLLNSEEKRSLYMIIKEAINNSIKYAECKAIFLSIREENRKLIIEISDDGKGYDPDISNDGLGIKNMLKRSHEIHYKAKIVSMKGKGTKITLEKNRL